MSFHNASSSSRALVLASTLALSALPARALPPGGALRHRDDRGDLTVFFETLRSVWLHVWGKEGMSIDPSGRPDGFGMTSVQGNEGMTIDPSGRPTITSSGEGTDEGMSIDPDG